MGFRFQVWDVLGMKLMNFGRMTIISGALLVISIIMGANSRHPGCFHHLPCLLTPIVTSEEEEEGFGADLHMRTLM